MKQILSLGLVLGWLLASALAFAQSTPSGKTGADSTSGASAVMGANYVIRPLDVIEFRVFQEPTMQQQLRVAQDGTVTLPLLGQVRIGGMTAGAAQEMIAELYDRDYLVNPQVSLIILSYNERRVFVHGQVFQQGPVLIPPEAEMTLVHAINAAGGRTRIASNTILIKRLGKDDIIRVNFSDVLTDPRTKDIILQDGDVITVQESVF